MEAVISPANIMSVAAKILPSSDLALKQTDRAMAMTEEGRGGGDGGGGAEMRRLLDGDVSASAQVDAQTLKRRTDGGEGGGGDGDTLHLPAASSPKKRVVMFSAFLACLSCVIILCNLFISFANDLLRDDAFLEVFQKYLKDQAAARNDSVPLPRVVT